jgi:hypothetical protein
VVFGCKLEDGRYGRRRSGSWLRHRFTAVAQVRAWRAGVLRRRRRKAAEPELLAAAQADVGRVGGGNTDGVVGRDRESGAYDELSPDGAGWGCLQAKRCAVVRPYVDRTSEVGGSFVVKALPAVTTRGGSAWQTSKGVLPTGARAPKQRAGSVDGVGRKAGSRGSKARITDRRTKADEAKTLVQPPAVLVTRITLD